MPSRPSTLAISCGSQIAVVTPCGRTQRSNSGRSDQRGFDVEVRVDEARHRDEALAVDLAASGIGAVDADDPVAADGDVGRLDAAPDDVEQADVLDDEVGRFQRPGPV